MSETFWVVLSQMLVFFLFLAAGYFLCKRGLISNTAGNILSGLEMYVFLPALCFYTFSRTVTMDTIQPKFKYLFYGIVLLLVSLGAAAPLSRWLSSQKDTRAVYLYSLTIPNIAYLGYPLISAVYGQDMLSNTMIFCLPMNIFIFTAGITMLNPKREFSIKKLMNPTMIATALGILTGLIGFSLPSFFLNACSTASACMAPIAMLTTGFVLARSPIKEMLKNKKAYIASFLRLIILPACLGTALYLLKTDSSVVIIAVALYAMPLGLNSVVFPEAFGGDSKTGAQACFISSVFGLITIPIVFSILSLIV